MTTTGKPTGTPGGEAPKPLDEHPSGTLDDHAAKAVVPVVAERGAPPPPSGLKGVLIRWQGIVVPLVALVLAFVVGAALIRWQGIDPMFAYQTLFTYAFGEGFTQTLEKTVPLILCGLAVTIPLRVGLFNIGGQGQIMAGAITAAALAPMLSGMPGVVVIVATLVVGVLAGAMWGSIAGLLKTTRGVHEVITTIMLNSIAAGIIDWLIGEGPLADRTAQFPATRPVPEAGVLTPVGGIPIGIPIALALALLTAWMLRRTTLGFTFETVGKNRFAATYAGVRANSMVLLAMAMAGGFAGLAGGIELLEIDPYRYAEGTAGALGFDGITIALLGRSTPLGTIPAALLVGAMRAGAGQLNFVTGIEPEVVDMLLAIILLFVSLPLIARLLYRRYAASGSQIASGWGS